MVCECVPFDGAFTKSHVLGYIFIQYVAPAGAATKRKVASKLARVGSTVVLH